VGGCDGGAATGGVLQEVLLHSAVLSNAVNWSFGAVRLLLVSTRQLMQLPGMWLSVVISACSCAVVHDWPAVAGVLVALGMLKPMLARNTWSYHRLSKSVGLSSSPVVSVFGGSARLS
jgi:hypothetical protein